MTNANKESILFDCLSKFISNFKDIKKKTMEEVKQCILSNGYAVDDLSGQHVRLMFEMP